MKKLRKLTGPVLLAAILLLAVRGLLVGHLQLARPLSVPGLPEGEHVLVGLTDYGLRLPGEAYWGYHRLGYGEPRLLEGVVFTVPVDRKPNQKPLWRYEAGLCSALPGDTVWVDPERRLILPARTSPDARPVVVPRSGQAVNLTPHNARLMAYLLTHYEHVEAQPTDSGRLLVGGRETTRVRLRNDYYWIETRPDSFLLVPHRALVGKILCAFSF